MLGGIGRAKAILGVLAALIVVIGGAVAVGVIGAPSVEEVQNRFAGVDDETSTIETDLVVSNPNPIGIRLGGVTVNYTVDLNGVRLASGTKTGVNVSTGNSTLTFRTAMDNEQIPKWWVAHIRDGERSDLAVHAEARSSTIGRTVAFDPVDREITTDLLSSFNSSETRPLNANRPVVSDPVLYINESSAAWGSVSEAETPMRMAFDVYNPKTTPYTVTGIGYEITMNEIPVGSGESDRAYTIPPKETRTVRAVTAIDNSALDDWWVSHLERNQVTELRIDFYARLELSGGQEIRLPLNALTYEETIETDMFGTKNASAGGDDDGEGESSETTTAAPTEDGSGSTTTAPSGTETTTSGESETTTTETTTDGSTTTEDDGGLLG